MRILVLRDPQPRVSEPWYVKEAYIHLVLTVEREDPAGISGEWEQGAYLVRYGVLMQALWGASLFPAYWWFHRTFSGPNHERVSSGAEEFLMVFPKECCEVIPDQMH